MFFKDVCKKFVKMCGDCIFWSLHVIPLCCNISKSINRHSSQINDFSVQKWADHFKSSAQSLELRASCDNSCRKRHVCVFHFLMVTQPMRLETEREEPRPRCAWWKTLDLTKGILQGKAETCLITLLSVLLWLPWVSQNLKEDTLRWIFLLFSKSWFNWVKYLKFESLQKKRL